MPSAERDGINRVGGLTLNKIGTTFSVQGRYAKTDAGEYVAVLGRSKYTREADWADVPQSIKDSLAAIEAWWSAGAEENAGLTT